MVPTRQGGVVTGVLIVAVVVLAGGGCRGSGSHTEDQKAYDTMTSLTTVEEFQEKVLEADRPVLVDFYATWCGPCKRLAPTIGSLAREFEGRVDFIRIDGDQAVKLRQKMNIRAYPTVLIYVDGERTSTYNFATRETFAKALDKAIAKSSQ